MNFRAIQNITDFIFMNDDPKRCDVILIPGTSKSAVTEKAAQLYHAGYAEHILPSGMFSPNVGRFARENIDNSRYDGPFETDFEYCRHILLSNGVPTEAILCEDHATNTMENAEYSARVLRERNMEPNRAILCCQAFHARRAFMSYANYFTNTEILVIPADTQGITAENWYRSEKSYRKVMSEVAKCGKYFVDCWQE